jgi:hypothetical protein
VFTVRYKVNFSLSNEGSSIQTTYYEYTGRPEVSLCDHIVQTAVFDVYYAPMMYLLSCHNKSGNPAGLNNISMKVSDVRVQVDSKPSHKGAQRS